MVSIYPRVILPQILFYGKTENLLRISTFRVRKRIVGEVIVVRYS